MISNLINEKPCSTSPPLDRNRMFEVDAKGEHMFSTGFAGGGAWTTLVEEGVKNLDQNLVLKFKDFQQE